MERMKIITTEVEETECCGARVIQVVETRFARGDGAPGNEVRAVRQYWSMEGHLLAEAEDRDAFGTDHVRTAADIRKAIRRMDRRIEMYENQLAAMEANEASLSVEHKHGNED